MSIGENTFDAVMIAEGVQEATLSEQLEAWAHLIKTGLVWNLQGFFGRNAHNLIHDLEFISADGEVTNRGWEYIAEREDNN